MHIVVVGLSHRTAPVEVREKLSIPDQSITESLKALKAFSDVLEVSILSTCNRLEIYALVKDKNTGISSIKEFISEYSGIIFEDLNPHLFCFRQEEAVLHLMKVSAGLDSLVLGEGQILSQVKKMMRLGQENQSTGPILNRLLTQSVSTGKKVRSETNLGTGAVSISSAAVELAQLKIGQEKGLDTLVSLGEGQILSQVKKMMRLGQENQSTGPILNRLLTQSVSTGKKVRSETNLGTGAVSISSAAVELAQLKIGQEKGFDTLVSLESENVLVVGAGRMSRLLITHLKSKGCHKLILLNRNIDRALNLAQDFPDLEIVCRGLNELEENISLSSIVFTSTASEEPIIDLAKIEKLNLSNRLKFIDIGVPRNISNDVKQHEFVKSFDVDDLQEVVSRNQEFRQKIAKEAESLVEEERIIFLEWWASLEAVPVINKLRSDLELIRKEELQKALSRMGPDFSARERKVVEALTKGIINKILHTPVTKLRSPQSREERQVSLKIVEKLFSLVEEDKNN